MLRARGCAKGRLVRGQSLIILGHVDVTWRSPASGRRPSPRFPGRHKLPTTCPLFLRALLSPVALHHAGASSAVVVVVVVIPSLGSLRAERAADIPSQSPSFTLTPSPIPCISRRLFHRDTTVATLCRLPSIPPAHDLRAYSLAAVPRRLSRSLARRSGSGSDLPWRRHPMLL